MPSPSNLVAFRKEILCTDDRIVLLIDLGSSNRRAYILNQEGKYLARITCPQFPLRNPDDPKSLTEHSIQITAAFLENIARIFPNVPFHQRICFATEAVRAAGNQNAFKAACSQGYWNIEILQGKEEARLIGRTIAAQQDGFGLVVHLGGGSLDRYYPETGRAFSQPKPSLPELGDCRALQKIFGNKNPGFVAITGSTAHDWVRGKPNHETIFYSTLLELWGLEAELIPVPLGIREGMFATRFPGIQVPANGFRGDLACKIEFNPDDLDALIIRTGRNKTLCLNTAIPN